MPKGGLGDDDYLNFLCISNLRLNTFSPQLKIFSLMLLILFSRSGALS
jgi:hypothetical protein